MEKKNTLTKTSVVCLLALVCCLLWGSAFPSVKIGYRMFNIHYDDSASQLLFAGIRFTLAGVFVILFGSIVSRKPLVPKRSAWLKVSMLSLFQTILQYYFYYLGIARTTGVKASIIVGANVFTAILISALFFKLEKLTTLKIIGCIIGFSGIVVMNSGDILQGFSLNIKGDGFIFLSTIAYAFSSVTMKKLSVGENTVMLSGYQFFIGGIVLTSLGLAFGGKISGFTVTSVTMLIYLALISAVAYSIWSILLKHNPVSKVAVFGFMNPIFGVVLSAIILNEGKQAFGIIGIVSLLLVCVGIFAVNKSRDK